MNLNEYGVVVLFNTGFDMSGYSQLSIRFTKPDKTQFTVTSPDVSLGMAPITTTLGVFAAHQYVAYTILPGQIDQAGCWKARVIYDDISPRHLISGCSNFTVPEDCC